MSRQYEAYSLSQKGLPYFSVTGGPFASPQQMGWHIVDTDTGLTAAVSCDNTLCARLNALEVVARIFERRDLYYLISNKLHDGGYLEIPEDEWESFRDAVKIIGAEGD